MADNNTSEIYVTLVMLGDKYALGAMVVAHALRKTGTAHQIWCMVTPDVSAQARLALSAQFDRIVDVPLITKNSKRLKTDKQNVIYGGWIDHSYTKWNALNPDLMPGVSRCIFVDADAIIRENVDDLFELPGPAGVFGTPWATPYMRGSSAIPNAYLSSTGAPPTHGQLITKEQIRAGLARGFVADASLLLLVPDRGAFQLVTKKLSSARVYGHPGCHSGSDEQLLADVMVASNTGPYSAVYNIHQSYSCHVGKESWAEGRPVRISQYYNGKPWNDVSTRADLQRILSETTWPDLAEWWSIAEEVIAETPAAEELYFPGSMGSGASSAISGGHEQAANDFLTSLFG